MQQSLFSWMLGGVPAKFGIFGIFSGAAIIFFAFIGFDNAATVAEETINPKKNVPIGLLVGVGVVSLLYVLTAVVTAGMVPTSAFQAWEAANPDSSVSIATAFEIVGQNWAGAASSFGAFVGLSSVVLIAMMGLSRVVFAMSRDGLFPRSFSITHKKFHTPHRIQITCGVVIALIASLTKVELLAEMINIGTLSAFVVVSFAVPVLRNRQKAEGLDTLQLEKDHFRVPFSPVLPIISGVVCIWLSLNLAIETWAFFAIWLGVGLIFYFSFGRRNSGLAKNPEFCAV
jgi:APA family basic amino acid/polyamine antiporter